MSSVRGLVIRLTFEIQRIGYKFFTTNFKLPQFLVRLILVFVSAVPHVEKRVAYAKEFLALSTQH